LEVLGILFRMGFIGIYCRCARAEGIAGLAGTAAPKVGTVVFNSTTKDPGVDGTPCPQVGGIYTLIQGATRAPEAIHYDAAAAAVCRSCVSEGGIFRMLNGRCVSSGCRNENLLNQMPCMDCASQRGNYPHYWANHQCQEEHFQAARYNLCHSVEGWGNPPTRQALQCGICMRRGMYWWQDRCNARPEPEGGPQSSGRPDRPRQQRNE
jgi:hypothetical protein